MSYQEMKLPGASLAWLNFDKEERMYSGNQELIDLAQEANDLLGRARDGDEDAFYRRRALLQELESCGLTTEDLLSSSDSPSVA